MSTYNAKSGGIHAKLKNDSNQHHYFQELLKVMIRRSLKFLPNEATTKLDQHHFIKPLLIAMIQR